MRRFALLCFCMTAAPAFAAEMRSDYTDLDLARDCALIAAGD